MTSLVLVPGAQLFTRKAGDGPALVLISGGGGDADMYDDVVPLLTSRFTVITFDRRGNSRSPLTDDSAPVDPDTQAADVVAVLDHHGVDRAYVFGTSGSAILTLALLSRHQDRVFGAVAHEPPLVQILPGSPEQRRIDELRHIADTEGPLCGFVAFAAMTMPNPPRLFDKRAGRVAFAGLMALVLGVGRLWRTATGKAPGGMARLVGNAGLTFRRELPAFCYDYEPDLAALSAVTVPWRLATGRDSVGRPYHRPAHVLGEKLGVPCVEFPGGHTPYQQYPAEFVDRLTEILDELTP
jgi:pimeloyl-ACP methyl ester carboxylesterase